MVDIGGGFPGDNNGSYRKDMPSFPEIAKNVRKAINDFMNPERIIIGTSGDSVVKSRLEEHMVDLYNRVDNLKKDISVIKNMKDIV